MAAGTKVIGRVAVRVLPDTSEFRRDAQRELDKIEKMLHFKVKIELDTRDLANQLNKVKDQIDRWRRGVSPVKVDVHLDLNGAQTQYVRDRLALLSRPRTVSFIPTLNEGAAARVMAALAALSGGRVLGDLLTNLKNIGTEFDRWAPKIGAAGLAIGGLSSLILTSVSNMFALTLAISQMATAALALPALFTGAAIGAGIAVVALIQMKAAVPDIFESFQKLGQLIGKNFWVEAASGIRALTSLYLPELGRTASLIGSFFGTLASDIAEPFKKSLPAMFANLNKAIEITSAKTGVFASIITTLGLTGSQYIPQLASWIGDLATKFDTFLTNAKADGALQQFIDAGIQGFKDLGTIILKAGQIVGDIGKAATIGGGSTLAILADTMERIRAVTSSPEFQVVLVEVFQAAHKVMSDIGRIAGPALVNFFEQLGATFVKIGPALGEGLGTALGAIANALASPAFTGGVVTIFESINTAIQELAPALPAVASAFGALAPVVGALLGVIAPLVTAALIPLGKVIEVLAPAVTPLIDVLGNGLLNIITALAPVVVMLAEALAPIVTMLTQSLAQVMPTIVSLFSSLLTTIAPLVVQLIQGLAPVLPLIVESFGKLAEALIPLIPPLGELLSAILIPLIPVIVQLAGAVFPVLIQVVSALTEILLPLIGVLTQLAGYVMPIVVAAFTLMAGAITNVFQPILTTLISVVVFVAERIVGAIQWLYSLWTRVFEALRDGVGGFVANVGEALGLVIDFFEELPGRIMGVFSNAGEWLLDAGDKIIKGLIEGIKNGFNAVKETLGGLTNLLPDWKGPASKDATLLFNAGQLVINGFVDGLESRYGAVRKSLQGLSGDISGMDMGVAKSGIGKAVDGALGASLGEGTPVKVLNYYAYGNGLSSEEDLFAAADRARMVGW